MRPSCLYLFIGLAAMGGCASTSELADPRDPLEPVNRSIHNFNEGVDKYAMKPLAEGYRAVAPSFVETGVRNFFSNLDDVTVLANNLLQFKLEEGTSDFLRLALNSSLGLLGLLDIGTEIGLRKHNEDFGQTLGRWGFETGPYLVLPFFGPSDFRDTAGLAVDKLYTDPLLHIEDIGIRNRTYLLSAISSRADLLDAKAAVEAAALDGYEFTRDFYLERRKALVYDGRPPRDRQ